METSTKLVPPVYNMGRDMTKPTKWLCAQRRLRSAWACAQSDQSLRCPHEESLGPKLPIKCTAKTLIRLGGWVFAGRTVTLLVLLCHGSIMGPKCKPGNYRPISVKIIWKEILWKYSIQSLKTAHSVLMSLFMRVNGRCDIPHAA